MNLQNLLIFENELKINVNYFTQIIFPERYYIILVRNVRGEYFKISTFILYYLNENIIEEFEAKEKRNEIIIKFILNPFQLSGGNLRKL